VARLAARSSSRQHSALLFAVWTTFQMVRNEIQLWLRRNIVVSWRRAKKRWD